MPNPVDPTQFNGTTSSYNLSGTNLTLNNTASSNARAACWVVISKDKKFAFVVNTLSGSVPETGSGKGSIARVLDRIRRQADAAGQHRHDAGWIPR